MNIMVSWSVRFVKKTPKNHYRRISPRNVKAGNNYIGGGYYLTQVGPVPGFEKKKT